MRLSSSKFLFGSLLSAMLLNSGLAHAENQILDCSGWHQGASAVGVLRRSEDTGYKPAVRVSVDADRKKLEIVSSGITLLADKWQQESFISSQIVFYPEGAWHEGRVYERLFLSDDLRWMNLLYLSQDASGLHSLVCVKNLRK